MNLPYPHFQINFKLYPGTFGTDGQQVAKTIDRVAEQTTAAFVLTPQLPDIRLLDEAIEWPIVAPLIDPVHPGRGMGKLLPEAISEVGAAGAVFNHAENRDTLDAIEQNIASCHDVGLDAIVCVDSLEMGRAVAAFEPDQLLFERPDDIASDRAISRTHPRPDSSVSRHARRDVPPNKGPGGWGYFDARRRPTRLRPGG